MTTYVVPMATAVLFDSYGQSYGSDHDIPMCEALPISLDLIGLIPIMPADLTPHLPKDAKTKSSHGEVRCVSLYNNSMTSRVLLIPKRLELYRNSTGEYILDFEKRNWPIFTESNDALLQLMDSQQGKLDELFCSARLAGGKSAELNLFFQKAPRRSALKVACISFPRKDQIRFDRLPAKEFGSILPMLQDFWKAGVTYTKRGSSIQLLTMKGDPWDRVDCISARVAVMGTLQRLYMHGWKKCIPLYGCMSGKSPIDSLMLMKDESYTASPRESFPLFCCIALGGVNRIRIIGQEDQGTKNAFVKAVKEGWSNGIKQNPKANDDTREMVLKGIPFKASSSMIEVAATSRLFCNLLEQMIAKGWNYYCTMNLSFNQDEKPSVVLVQDGLAPTGLSKVGCLSLAFSWSKGSLLVVGMPRRVVESIEKLLNSQSRFGFRCRKEMHGDNNFTLSFDLQLNTRNAKDKVERAKLCNLISQVLELLNTIGGEFLGTINLSDAQCECESFFVRFDDF